MRLLSILFLVLIVAAVGVFAWQNHEDVSLRFFEWGFAIPIAALIGVVYLLGMVSGGRSGVDCGGRSFGLQNTRFADLEGPFVKGTT